MCNLSQKIEDNGIAVGREEGEKTGRARETADTILRMYKNKFTMEQIEVATDKSREDILTILKEKADL